MKTDNLAELLREYGDAPKEFHATSYWRSYEESILDAIRSMDLGQLRSGKYPVLAAFGFNDVVYSYHTVSPSWKRAVFKFMHRHVIKDRAILPYQLSMSDVRELAYHTCELAGELSGAKPIHAIEVSTFGAPQDIFTIGGKRYTMPFLSCYLRYCFAQKHVSFSGDEVIVELGPGSGYQIEVLKKMYPDITVLCFDLPTQIYLCEQYLSRALGEENLVGTTRTLAWKDLSAVEKGRVHCFGNWQFPLLSGVPFDVFWNAASFGEMEPSVVANYLSYIKGNAKWIYLLQARLGKETTGRAHVERPITLADYNSLLSGYVLREEHNAWHAHKRLSQSGGYFEGVWSREKPVAA